MAAFCIDRVSLASSAGRQPARACIGTSWSAGVRARARRELEAEVQQAHAPIEMAEVHAAGPLVRSSMNSAIASCYTLILYLLAILVILPGMRTM